MERQVVFVALETNLVDLHGFVAQFFIDSGHNREATHLLHCRGADFKKPVGLERCREVNHCDKWAVSINLN